jgi:hypothetical protein
MASSYQVRLYNTAEGIDQTVEVPADKYILETAEEQGWNYPTLVGRAFVRLVQSKRSKVRWISLKGLTSATTKLPQATC